MGRRSWRKAHTAIERLIAEIHSEGYTVVFVEYVEDAETPGLLGLGAGVTIHTSHRVKISRNLTPAQTVATLEHELEHVRGAERGTDRPDLGLQCGGRGVLHAD